MRLLLMLTAALGVVWLASSVDPTELARQRSRAGEWLAGQARELTLPVVSPAVAKLPPTSPVTQPPGPVEVLPATELSDSQGPEPEAHAARQDPEPAPALMTPFIPEARTAPLSSEALESIRGRLDRVMGLASGGSL